MRVLVAGGAGFIGSNFVELLLKETGHDVVIYDCFTYAGSMSNIDESLRHSRVSLWEADIRKRDEVDYVMSRIDAVVNFAAETHVDNSIVSSKEFMTTNIIGTMVLADSAIKYGIRKFIQISTDEVYGSISGEGLFSEDSCLHPNNPYSASKASADMLLMSYFNTYNFPVVITRCTNNYGKRQYPEKIIPLFISNLKKNKKVPVYGDGLQIRDWIHVSDHCRAILMALERGENGQVYNVGSNNEITNIDLTRMLIKRMGCNDDRIEYVTDRPGHDIRYAIDTMKIQRDLGWSPAINFEEGLLSTIEWYKENAFK